MCYYHFCQNIREKAHTLHLLNNDFQNETNNLLNDLYLMPFKYNQNPFIIDSIEKKFFNKLVPKFKMNNNKYNKTAIEIEKI